MTDISPLSVFSEYIRRKPLRFLIGGIAVATWFHILRFWATQAGIFANTDLPISIYIPSLGWNMVVGPIIEIAKGIDPFDVIKILVFSVLLLSSAVSLFLSFKRPASERRRHPSKLENLFRVLTFLLIPALILPKSPLGLYVNISGILSVFFILFGLGFRSRELQTLSFLLGLATSYYSISAYYAQGKAFVDDCQMQVAIRGDEKSALTTGCWVTSSEKYIVLKSNSEIAVVPRNLVKSLRFQKKAGNQL